MEVIRKMNTEEAHAVLQKLSGMSASQNKFSLEVADMLFTLFANDAHKKLGYESFYSMLAENNINYSKRAVAMFVRAGWVKAVALAQGLENNFERYSIAKLEMVDTAVEHFLNGGDPESAKRFLFMAREIDHGGLSRSDIRKAMVEAGLVQPKPKRYLAFFYVPGQLPTVKYVLTKEDPTTAPNYVRLIAEVKKPLRSWEIPTVETFWVAPQKLQGDGYAQDEAQ